MKVISISLFFLVTVRIGEKILAPTTRFANSSEGGKQDVSSYQKWDDEKPGLKETLSLLRLQNSKPFLEGSREWKKSQADDGSDTYKKDKNKILVLFIMFTLGMLKNNFLVTYFKCLW